MALVLYSGVLYRVSQDKLTRAAHKDSDRGKPEASLAVPGPETGVTYDVQPIYNSSATKTASGSGLSLSLRNTLVNLP